MYKLVIVPPKTEPSALFKLDGDKVIMSIPFAEDNTDYQAYLKWLEEGNTPLPADEV
jgi:hypothetical protein